MTSLLLKNFSISIVALGLAAAPVGRARACGGMVFPEHSERAGGMSDQELLVVFEADRTVVLASAGYTDAPDGAAFLLPIRQDPLEVHEAPVQLFAALDDATAPEIAITVDDGSSDSGGLCASDGGAKNLDDGGGRGDGNILVHDRGETASYDYVIVGGDTGEALDQWLADAGYTLPDNYADALAPYVDDGYFFFAAKLKPGISAGVLPPVELHLPKIEVEAFAIPFGLAAQSLPPDEKLTITTYFLAPGGVAPTNYTTTRIDRDELVAVSPSQSNYDELYDAAAAADAWVLEASVSGYSPGRIVDDLEIAASEGRLTTEGLGELEALAGRLDFSDYRLTRLRTTLSATKLHDMQLQKIAGEDVSRYFAATYSSGVGCRVGGRPVPLVALMMPLLLLLRRRR